MESSSPSVSPEPVHLSLTRELDRMTPLNNTQSLPFPAPHIIHSFLNSNRQLDRQYSPPNKMEMDPKTSLLTQGYKPNKDDDDEFVPVAEPEDRQSERESSSESLPVRKPRPPQQADNTRGNATASTTAPGRRRPIPDNAQSSGYHETKFDQPVHQRSVDQTMSNLKTPVAKQRKKPGPQPWAQKPPKKNDMGVKMEVIREIESYWGKNFITAYIPKCHRPLTKRSKGKKHRAHENNPKSWMPSILKAMLGIAKLTQNKTLLKKSMDEIVRYRIKHTGNRKPQLTTTDFDVLEDMLVQGWEVEYSFPIRYKHLLVEGKSQDVNDEDIDNILGVRTGTSIGQDNSSESEDECFDDSEDVAANNNHDSDNNLDDDDTPMKESGLSNQYLQPRGYTSTPQNHPSASPLPKSEQTKTSKRPKSKSKPTNLPSVAEQQSMQRYNQAHSQGPPGSPWGYTMQGPNSGPVDPRTHNTCNAYGSYGGLPNFNGYGGYGQPGKDGRTYPQQWAHHGMNQWPPYHPLVSPSSPADFSHGNHVDAKSAQFSPSIVTPRPREGYNYTTPELVRQSLEPQGYADSFNSAQSGPQHNLGDEDSGLAVDDTRGPTHDIDDETAAIEAELRATELELKVAQLKAKQAAMRLQMRNR